MNIKGRELLSKFGFNPPVKNVIGTYNSLYSLDLNKLYEGNRCGLSIEIAPACMKLSDGPNPMVKLSGAHNISREDFFEATERVVSRARNLGFSPTELLFAVCQSIPHSVSMSGICARVEEDSIGYLACELLNGVRNGDFTPDYGIQANIIGGRPMGHTRRITMTGKHIPSWAVNQMYNIMKKVDKFDEGIAGVEFVLDRELKTTIFHDMYWSLKPHQEISDKFKFKKIEVS